MNALLTYVGAATLLGSLIVGGVFFAFSSFVMKALAKLPSSEGMAAMQSINVVVINPSFLGVFMGTALLSMALVVLAFASRSHPAANWMLCGALVYVVGTFLVTVTGNVPLNNQLAAQSAANPESVELWSQYLERWTLWNHLRTVAAIAAGCLVLTGLVRGHAGF